MNVIEKAEEALQAGAYDHETGDVLREILAIVKRLPVTADGVPVVAGDSVWRWKRRRGFCGQVVGADMVIEECEVWDHCRYCECDRVVSSVWEDEVAMCYSTRAAAEAAREGE